MEQRECFCCKSGIQAITYDWSIQVGISKKQAREFPHCSLLSPLSSAKLPLITFLHLGTVASSHLFSFMSAFSHHLFVRAIRREKSGSWKKQVLSAGGGGGARSDPQASPYMGGAQSPLHLPPHPVVPIDFDSGSCSVQSWLQTSCQTKNAASVIFPNISSLPHCL